MPLAQAKVMNTLIKAGMLSLLFPIALLDSVSAIILGIALFVISLLVDRKLNYLDGILVFLLGMYGLSWVQVDSYSRYFITSQMGAYFLFVLVFRFLYVCRVQLLSFIADFPLYGYALICLIYLAVQIKMGYGYELGILEAFILIRLIISDRYRNWLFAMLIVFLVLMAVISTRNTPIFVVLILASIRIFNPPSAAMRAGYLLVILATPLLGFILLNPAVLEFMSLLDDNASIRWEMLKGATSTIDIGGLIWGAGFGTPFRDVNYDYLFRHPLLVDPFLAYQVSNHNSLFDIFRRFGIILYLAFAIHFLGSMKIMKISNRYYYCLLFVTLYSLSSNAYLDNTPLAIVTAVFVAGILFSTTTGYYSSTRRIKRFAMRPNTALPQLERSGFPPADTTSNDRDNFHL